MWIFDNSPDTAERVLRPIKYLVVFVEISSPYRHKVFCRLFLVYNPPTLAEMKKRRRKVKKIEELDLGMLSYVELEAFLNDLQRYVHHRVAAELLASDISQFIFDRFLIGSKLELIGSSDTPPEEPSVGAEDIRPIEHQALPQKSKQIKTLGVQRKIIRGSMPSLSKRDVTPCGEYLVAPVTVDDVRACARYLENHPEEKSPNPRNNIEDAQELNEILTDGELGIRKHLFEVRTILYEHGWFDQGNCH